MAVSAVGQGVKASAVRHAVATAAVFLTLFYVFYGPPLTQAFARSAEAECNRLTGSTYRHYTLEWRSTTLSSIHRPEWVCHDRRHPGRPGTSLGWWTGI